MAMLGMNRKVKNIVKNEFNAWKGKFSKILMCKFYSNKIMNYLSNCIDSWFYSGTSENTYSNVTATVKVIDQVA